MSQTSVGALVQRAAAGDEQAWNEIVDRYSGLLWSVARSCGLSRQRADDVVQTAWLRLLQHIGDLRDPDRVGAWLATTARREALRSIAACRREAPQGDESMWDRADTSQDPPDAGILRREQHERLAAAIAELPPRQQQLLRLLTADPSLSYRDVAAATGMPIGSIGPTRSRAMERLRALLAEEDDEPQVEPNGQAASSRASVR
jgi:RNA polymerase sigma factor (sigma-70 family)